MTTHKSISEPQILEIISLYKSGIGAETIAPQFNIVATTVIGILRERNIEIRPLSRLTSEDHERMKTLYTNGKTLKEIGIEFSMTEGGIRRIFKKYKFPLRMRTYTGSKGPRGPQKNKANDE